MQTKTTKAGVADSLSITIVRDPCGVCPSPRVPPFDTHVRAGDTLLMPDKSLQRIGAINVSGTAESYILLESCQTLILSELKHCSRACPACGRPVV